jgi:hypothetical protein
MLRMHPNTLKLFYALGPEICKMYITSVHICNTLHELYCRYIFVPFLLTTFPGFTQHTLYIHECPNHTAYKTRHLFVFRVKLPRTQHVTHWLAVNILHILKYTYVTITLQQSNQFMYTSFTHKATLHSLGVSRPPPFPQPHLHNFKGKTRKV